MIHKREQTAVVTEARVELHLNGGFTQLILDAGGSPFQVRTDELPVSDRSIGSKVLIKILCDQSIRQYVISAVSKPRQ